MKDTERQRRPIGEWAGFDVPAGERRNVELTVSESYSGTTVKIPIHVRRAKEEGPVLFVTAALHGDEINGTGAIRRLILDPELHLLRGALVLVPVLNILAFERHSRYLPDRRDLNRSFPGMAKGSLASRMARSIFDEIVSRADYGIDLHTAAVRRSNFPNVRADLENSEARRLAEAFGCEIIVANSGPEGSFRREACDAGCPTIIMEGGEVWKLEPGVVNVAVRGVKNVMRSLHMIDGAPDAPTHRIVVEKSKWIRAEYGGFMRFHTKPGDIVSKDQHIATNTSLLGQERNRLHAPFDAVVIGMSTLPSLNPGDPVFNLGKLPDDQAPSTLRRTRDHEGGLEEELLEEFSTLVVVVDPE